MSPGLPVFSRALPPIPGMFSAADVGKERAKRDSGAYELGKAGQLDDRRYAPV
jgi:hypothetical protein